MLVWSRTLESPNKCGLGLGRAHFRQIVVAVYEAQRRDSAPDVLTAKVVVHGGLQQRAPRRRKVQLGA
jgi:hypothetical protein